MAEKDECKQLFLNELTERLESLSTLVLDLEKNYSNIDLVEEPMRIVTALVEEAMRILHSIKAIASLNGDGFLMGCCS